jgi:hypothetical protein
MPFFAALVLPPLILAGVAQAAPTDDAYAIYDRARQVWFQQSYPDVIQYQTTIRVAEGDRVEQEHFRSEATSDGDVRLAGVSEEETSDPHQASGVNFKLHFEFGWNTHSDGPLASRTDDAHRKESSPDYLGTPLISPIYSFGLDDRVNSANSQQAAQPNTVPNLPTIATVFAVNRNYDITLIGQEPLGGFLTYHLQLKPLRNPQRYRLRELWIDAYTYHVLQLAVQGNFVNSPMKDVPWLVTFQDIGGSTFIESETTQAPLVFKHDRTFTTASIRFNDITEGTPAEPILPYMGSGSALREP